jgi:ABC-type uncharacterized transport system substrate-binding protein
MSEFSEMPVTSRTREQWRPRLVHAAIGLAALTAGALMAPGCAGAHPHVWIGVVAELLYGPNGSITGVRQVWTFDEMFSTFATRGIEQKTQGTFSREELGPLAQTYIDGLKDFGYFTFVRLDGERQNEVSPAQQIISSTTIRPKPQSRSTSRCP